MLLQLRPAISKQEGRMSSSSSTPMPARFAVTAAAAALFLACFTTNDARAQSCGDADGTNGVLINDAVRVLRAAASLTGECPPSRCDVDGSVGITVNDGLDVLRFVASITGQPTGCRNPDAAGTIDQVQTGDDGSQADLTIGGPSPLPGQTQSIATSCDPDAE